MKYRVFGKSPLNYQKINLAEFENYIDAQKFLGKSIEIFAQSIFESELKAYLAEYGDPSFEKMGEIYSEARQSAQKYYSIEEIK